MPARYRYHSDMSLFDNVHVTLLGNGAPIIYDDYDDHLHRESVPRDFEVFNDVVGQDGVFTPCYHYSFKGSYIDPYEYLWHGPGYPECTEYDTPLLLSHLTAPDWSIPRALEPSKPSAASLSEWSNEAFNKFHDQIPETVKLANFLYELKDIQGLIPRIVRGSPTKTLSSNFLALEFGWKPMLGDIKKIMELSTAVAKRLKHLQATYGKTTSLFFQRNMQLSDEPYALVKSWDGVGGSLTARNFRYKRVSQSGVFRVTGKLRQKIHGTDDFFGHMKALAASTGFNNPLAIVWEAIPYSFVVDWFFHLDAILGKMAIQPFEGEWQLSKVGWSVKQQAQYFVYQEFLLGPPHGNLSRYLGEISLKSYTREPGFPMTSLFVTDGSLTPKQLVLSLALLNQRR